MASHCITDTLKWSSDFESSFNPETGLTGSEKIDLWLKLLELMAYKLDFSNGSGQIERQKSWEASFRSKYGTTFSDAARIDCALKALELTSYDADLAIEAATWERTFREAHAGDSLTDEEEMQLALRMLYLWACKVDLMR